MNDIYDKQPVNLSLVHVYTPLSSVKEIDCSNVNNNNNSNSNSLTITTSIATTTPEYTVKYMHWTFYWSLTTYNKNVSNINKSKTTTNLYHKANRIFNT